VTREDTENDNPRTFTHKLHDADRRKTHLSTSTHHATAFANAEHDRQEIERPHHSTSKTFILRPEYGLSSHQASSPDVYREHFKLEEPAQIVHELGRWADIIRHAARFSVNDEGWQYGAKGAGRFQGS